MPATERQRQQEISRGVWEHLERSTLLHHPISQLAEQAQIVTTSISTAGAIAAKIIERL